MKGDDKQGTPQTGENKIFPFSGKANDVFDHATPFFDLGIIRSLMITNTETNISVRRNLNQLQEFIPKSINSLLQFFSQFNGQSAIKVLNLSHIREPNIPADSVMKHQHRKRESIVLPTPGESLITSIISRCPGLTSLTLSSDVMGGIAITDIGLTNIAHSCHMLDNLRINGCSEISDIGLRAIAKHCKNLINLELNGSYKHITSDGVKAIADSCPIEKVSLNGCYNVTPDALDHLAKKRPNLKELHIDRCSRNLSGIGVQLLKGSFPEAERFTLHDSRKWTSPFCRNGGMWATRVLEDKENKEHKR